MRYRSSVGHCPWVLAALLLPLAMGAGWAVAANQNAQSAPSRSDLQLSPAQIQSLVTRVIRNQEKNDRALDEYERREHEVDHNGKEGKDPAVETTSRMVPTGAGSTRIVLERNGAPTDSTDLEQQWENVASMLAAHSNPQDARTKQDREKTERRLHERAELEEAFGKAFRFHWVSRTNEGGRTLVELAFDPEPNFRSSVRFANVFEHLHGTIWLDEDSGQMAKLKVELSDDVSFYGILAKVYRGAKLEAVQMEVTPDLWLPSMTAYDLEIRKLLFTTAVHERIDVSDYRSVGPPEAALTLYRREHPSIAAKTQ